MGQEYRFSTLTRKRRRSLLLWTVLAMTMFAYELHVHWDEAHENARNAGRTLIEKDITYRKWNAWAGGVYVPVTEQIQPNPYLSGVPGRDIITEKGRRLTLINPAYMTRMVHEIERSMTSIQGHITSLKPIRPENEPDAWEREALQAFESGTAEVSHVQRISGAKYMRVMRPLRTDKACLKCHASQGYQEGDIRGGISVSVPIAPYYASMYRSIFVGGAFFVVFWGVGVVLIIRQARGDEKNNAALRQSEARLRESQRIAHIGHYTFDVADGEWINSPELDTIFGIDQTYCRDVEGWLRIVHPEQRTDMRDYLIGHVLRDRSVFDKEYRIQRISDGAVRWVHGRGQLDLDPAGRPIRMFGTIQDITERKIVEEELSRREELYRQLFENNPHCMWVYDRKTLAFLAVNDAAVAKYGFSRPEFLSMTIADIRPKEDVAALRGWVVQLPAGIRRSGIWRHRIKDGTIIEVEIVSHSITVEGREASLVLINDVTEQRRAAAALAESEQRFKTLAEASFEGIAMSEQGMMIDVNDQLCLMLGCAREDLIGKAVDAFVPAVPGGAPLEDPVAVLSPYEQMLARGDGSQLPVEIRMRDLQLGTRVIRVTAIRDISERKRAVEEKERLEMQLVQAQKMESIGRLAGGVAHDFNNMLTVILGYAELLKRRLPPGDPLLRNVEEIEKAADRSRDTTSQLLAFSRNQIIAPRSLNLNDQIASIMPALSRLIGEDIDLRFLPEEGLWQVSCDPSQVDQVLMNLTVNARDAMPRGGTLSIETANASLDDAYCSEHLSTVPGDYVLMAVSDSGIGMDNETIRHIFEPFFTTKEVGKGTGLGLATVYGIIQQNNGAIYVYSEPGQGTTFKIYLPRLSGDPGASAEDAPPSVSRATGSVLLVEDDAMVREITTAMLRTIGCEVFSADTPLVAVSLCENRDIPIDLLITDVVMPGASGKELRTRIEDIRPGIKVLFMSGYTSEVIVRHGVLDDGVNFIQKPFTLDTLAHKVDELLARKQTGS